MDCRSRLGPLDRASQQCPLRDTEPLTFSQALYSFWQGGTVVQQELGTSPMQSQHIFPGHSSSVHLSTHSAFPPILLPCSRLSCCLQLSGELNLRRHQGLCRHAVRSGAELDQAGCTSQVCGSFPERLLEGALPGFLHRASASLPASFRTSKAYWNLLENSRDSSACLP